MGLDKALFDTIQIKRIGIFDNLLAKFSSVNSQPNIKRIVIADTLNAWYLLKFDSKK